jgi:multiple sugar transport system ATP-binding protein
MRAELARLHARLGVTTVYVTHDQTEAMTLGDRVCVMLDGVIQQVDTPARLYREPANAFVANFIGSPSMNLALAPVSDGAVVLSGHRLELSAPQRARVGARTTVVVGMRPADFALRAVDVQSHDAVALDRVARLAVTPEVVEHLGSEQLVVFPVEAERYQVGPVAGSTDDDETLLADPRRSRFTARLDVRRELRVDQPAELFFDLDRLYLFDPMDGSALVDAPVAQRPTDVDAVATAAP